MSKTSTGILVIGLSGLYVYRFKRRAALARKPKGICDEVGLSGRGARRAARPGSAAQAALVAQHPQRTR